MHICTHMLKYSSKIMTKSDKIIQRRGLMHAWEVWVGGIQWIVKTTCKSFSVCYNVCFKLTFRNEMLWNIFLKNTVFVWNFFFKFWTKGEYMESLKFIFIIIDIKALCISENWEFLTCNDKLNKQKSATCKSGKENVNRKHWVIHVINFNLDMQG